MSKERCFAASTGIRIAEFFPDVSFYLLIRSEWKHENNTVDFKWIASGIKFYFALDYYAVDLHLN